MREGNELEGECMSDYQSDYSSAVKACSHVATWFCCILEIIIMVQNSRIVIIMGNCCNFLQSYIINYHVEKPESQSFSSIIIITMALITQGGLIYRPSALRLLTQGLWCGCGCGCLDTLFASWSADTERYHYSWS